MVTLIKVDFQASLYKGEGIVSKEDTVFFNENFKLLHMIICKISNVCELANCYVQCNLKFLIQKFT